MDRVIVVDDASGDSTREVIRSVGDPRILFFERGQNGGIAAARRDAFALSDADWTVNLDSDHELLVGAIDGLARLLASAPQSVDILGARYQWDTGGVTPVDIPEGIVGYRERIILSGQNDNIGADYLCTVSKRLRQLVQWEPLRGSFPDTLFQLDIAKIGRAVFTSDALAFEKSNGAHSWTRGSAEQRWARRCKDAHDSVRALELILSRHGSALRRWGKPKLAGLFGQGAFFAALSSDRRLAWRWAAKSFSCGFQYGAWYAPVMIVLPRFVVRQLYLARG